MKIQLNYEKNISRNYLLCNWFKIIFGLMHKAGDIYLCDFYDYKPSYTNALGF